MTQQTVYIEVSHLTTNDIFEQLSKIAESISGVVNIGGGGYAGSSMHNFSFEADNLTNAKLFCQRSKHLIERCSIHDGGEDFERYETAEYKRWAKRFKKSCGAAQQYYIGHTTVATVEALETAKLLNERQLNQLFGIGVSGQ